MRNHKFSVTSSACDSETSVTFIDNRSFKKHAEAIHENLPNSHRNQVYCSAILWPSQVSIEMIPQTASSM